MRRLVIGITLVCFVATQTTALAQPHAEGTAAGQAANAAARPTINAGDAAAVVPGYTASPPESAYHGQPNLGGQANARLSACAATPDDPVCEAQVGASTSANLPRDAISPYDPAVAEARRIAANPSLSLENIASFYSGCQIDTVPGAATETRVCRQYSGAGAQRCARSLTVSVARSSSCTPGEWFVSAASGATGAAVQCLPDRPAARQHFRVTQGGTPLAYFDVDMGTPLVFPQRVATLPNTGAGWGGGQNGAWVADNQCVGDACRLTVLIAREYRLVCSGEEYGYDIGGNCEQVRPFLEVYGACPAGTQSGNHILNPTSPGGEPGEWQPTWLDEARCYAPTSPPGGQFGIDQTGTVPGYFWGVHSQRPVVGWKLNPAYGPIPRMTLSYLRPHTEVAEADRWDDHCPALAADGRCAVSEAARCVDGPATKLIDGAPVTRDCWRYETALSCAHGAPSDECAPLAAAGCTPAGTVCRQANAATGSCEIAEHTYTCPVAAGTALTASNCPADVFCVAGHCFSTAYTHDADFARSMSYLEAAREAGVYLDTDTMRVFSGEAAKCRDRLLKDCCLSDSSGAGMTNQSLFGTGSRLVYDVLMNSSNRAFLYQGMQALLLGGGFSGSFTTYGVTVAINGAAVPAGSVALYSGTNVVIAFDPWSLAIAVVIYVVMSMMSCNENEGRLALQEGARLCRKIGTYCSSCIRVLGKCVSCIEHTTGKCCFNSVLARIVNEQGRAQVGKGWGSARNPDCSGFTIAQLQALDFAAMDLSELYASIVPTLPDVGALQSDNAARAGQCYYGQGRCP
ncbi:conjugal transfer protein TraN [Pseudothauera nasutitermitis]|uniref:Conjugal transfer protein TraN n=1 Tax=Pseudothauera nasutitermitis TaxID=2565930 RepID=A0A4S4AXT0_9RHOO|nr:type-F conjugative transfer system mating-pair stabilization protein TraN [Pseudothauera nasutitermitis]THF64933.1 conjugal transfer protein TraN [Pseudothauera nasutitermitis]